MHSHTAKEVAKLLSDFLPHGYSNKILENAKKNGIETYTQRIRGVKSLVYADLEILNLLIELAKENEAVAEAQKKKLEELTSKP